MKRSSDQASFEEPAVRKHQRRAPELYDVTLIRHRVGDTEFYKERFFRWRRINNRDDPNQPFAAKADSWRSFARLENEGKMERLLSKTPSHDKAAHGLRRGSVSRDATSLPRSCEPRREHQTREPASIPTCPNSVDSRATELDRSVDESTASSRESVGLRDQQSTPRSIDALPDDQSVEVGLNAKTIERLWKWKSAHRVRIEALEVRHAVLQDRCESLDDQLKGQESTIDLLTDGQAQLSAMESRIDHRFDQVHDELVRLQKAEKTREAFQERLLRSVAEAGALLEVLRKEYQSRLRVLEAVKDESFDVLQRLYAEKRLHDDELRTLRDQVEQLQDRLDHPRRAH
ncbi:hypothetical protein FI667_g13409, partial [Globisporangium splendens]